MKLQTQWDLSKLGSGINDNEFKIERELMEKKYKSFARKWKKDKTFLVDEKSLKKALDQYEKISQLGNKEQVFIFLSMQTNAGDPELQSAYKKMTYFINDMIDEIRFFILDLGKIEIKNQKKFLESEMLGDYKNFLKNIFNKSKYHLSNKEERILSLKSGVSNSNWSEMIDEFLAQSQREILVPQEKGSPKKQLVGLETIITYTGHINKKVRKVADAAFTSILSEFEPVAEKEFNSLLEDKKINDELRGYSRPDSSRHINEDIETEAVDILREVVADNFKVSRAFFKLKSQLLKQEKFKYSERNLEYGKISKKYSYNESVDLVTQAFNNIHSKFTEIFTEFTFEGNIDVEPKKGKRGGAFCMSYGVADPVYIMLNHTDSVRDIATIAHEMGHAIHAVLGKKENQLNYDTPMCTAEAASTFCEDFVFQELLHNVNDEQKLALMMKQLQDKVNTVFRQIAAYNFELEIHNEFRKQGFLPKQVIGNLFNKHMKSYLGSSFELDNDSSLGWVYWSHFRSPFYVYSYAMGLLCAQSMQAKFTKNPEFISEIMEFYTTRTSLSPKEIYEKMGMDITDPHFWQSGIDEINDLLKETKKLAKKLGKIK